MSHARTGTHTWTGHTQGHTHTDCDTLAERDETRTQDAGETNTRIQGDTGRRRARHETHSVTQCEERDTHTHTQEGTTLTRTHTHTHTHTHREERHTHTHTHTQRAGDRWRPTRPTHPPMPTHLSAPTQAGIICCSPNVTYAGGRIRTHVAQPDAHIDPPRHDTGAPTQRTHARTHARTHTHTHTQDRERERGRERDERERKSKRQG